MLAKNCVAFNITSNALLASGSDPEQKCDDGLVLYSILLLSSAYSITCMPSPLFCSLSGALEV